MATGVTRDSDRQRQHIALLLQLLHVMLNMYLSAAFDCIFSKLSFAFV